MEKIIAYHCAPAMAGIKPSNIVSCYRNKVEDIEGQIKRLNGQLNPKDIYIETICECKNRVLVMVYRKKVLKEALETDEVRDFLIECGYPEEGDYRVYIDHLKHNLKKNGITHEIGAFLGYPINDIYGFVENKGEGCLLCGEWKVYDNVKEAQRLFERFDKCRRALCARVATGKSLAQVFC